MVLLQKKLKILLVTDAWHPQVNGVVTAISSLTKALEAEGHAVTVLHPGLFRSAPFPLYPEIPIFYASAKHIGRVLHEGQFDHVHIATEWLLGFAVRNWCVKNAAPFSTAVHTNFPLYVKHYIPIGASLVTAALYRYLRWFHTKAVVTLVTTETLKTQLIEKGFTSVSVWPLGIDTDFFVRTNSETEQLPKPVFMYLGRIAKEKNIEAFLNLDLPGTKLVIGDGPERMRMQAAYPSVLFVGYKRGIALIEWMSKADVCVFPSLTDTFGLTIIESLSCGIPVAAYDVLGPKDILTNGIDGYLGDDLRSQALKCLTLRPADCRATATNYSLQKSADAFLLHTK